MKKSKIKLPRLKPLDPSYSSAKVYKNRHVETKLVGDTLFQRPIYTNRP